MQFRGTVLIAEIVAYALFSCQTLPADLSDKVSDFMNYTKLQWWKRFQKYYTEFPALGLAVDLSRMNVDDEFFAAMEPRIQKAFADMAALGKGRHRQS